jgi:hypothetical protein
MFLKAESLILGQVSACLLRRMVKYLCLWLGTFSILRRHNKVNKLLQTCNWSRPFQNEKDKILTKSHEKFEYFS